MPATPKFPAPMHHPKTGGETTAATSSSLRVLEARGWKRGLKPTETPTAASRGSSTSRPPAPDSDDS